MGVLVVRQSIEDGSVGGLSGSRVWPCSLKPVNPGDKATRMILHMPSYLRSPPSGSCSDQSIAQRVIRNLVFGYSLSFSWTLEYHFVGFARKNCNL